MAPLRTPPPPGPNGPGTPARDSAEGSPRLLVLIRHAKSAWDEPLSDHDRPLAPRGRRQAPLTGGWLASHLPIPLESVVVSTAVRAQQTWELVAAELGDRPVRVSCESAAYTFSGGALRRIVAELSDTIHCAALVGHNPALEELIYGLTGEDIAMPTSALAVVALPTWATEGVLLTYGRPADGGLPPWPG